MSTPGEQPPPGVRFLDQEEVAESSIWAGVDEAELIAGPASEPEGRRLRSPYSAVVATLRRTVAPAFVGALVGILLVSAARTVSGSSGPLAPPEQGSPRPLIVRPRPFTPEHPVRKAAAGPRPAPSDTRAQSRRAGIVRSRIPPVLAPASAGAERPPVPGPSAAGEFGFER